MFSEKLNDIIGFLGASSGDIAAAAGYDRSNINRFRSGKRTPSVGGVAVRRIAEGIYLFADENGKTRSLAAHVGCTEPLSFEKIRDGIIGFLFDGEDVNGAKTRKKEKTPNRTFGQRLGFVMDLCGFSNIRFGNLLHVDPSYISRFKNGFRSPAPGSKLADDMCGILAARISEQKKTEELAAAMRVSQIDENDADSLCASLGKWMFGTESDKQNALVEGLVDKISCYPADIGANPLSFIEATSGGEMDDTRAVYYGQNGLRRAVIRFLGNVVVNKPTDIWLYSDQNMGWLVSDTAFRAKWASLMSMCALGGTRINIIHNVNRALPEMIDAIKSWMPLYHSGMIRSYYGKTLRSSDFSSTLFICRDHACISGSNVIGTEDKLGVYRYDVAPETISSLGSEYDELLSRAGELVHVCRVHDERLTDTSSLTTLGNMLSLATMPKETLIRALNRAGVDEETKTKATEYFKMRVEEYEDLINKGFVHECITLPSDEDIFGGKVFMDLPDIKIAYTPSDYSEHIKNVISISNAAGYRFFALPEAPFDDVKLFVTDKSVAVMRLKAPYFTLKFEHPDLCRAFTAYVEKIKEQYKKDKLTTNKLLERYI